MKAPLASTISSCLVLVLSSASFGADISWTGADPDDNLFSNPDNWDNGVPGTSDQAIFDLNSTFTIYFDADATTELLRIGDPDQPGNAHTVTTFDLDNGNGGHTYEVLGDPDPEINTAIQVSGFDDASQPGFIGAALVINNGTLRTPQNMTIAWSTGNSRTGSVTVTGPGARLEVDGNVIMSRNNERSFLVIQDGATADIGALAPGRFGNSASETTILVRDPGTVLELGALNRHQHGTMTFTVENGGQVTGGGNFWVSGIGGADGNVLVTGQNSRLVVGGIQSLHWISDSNRSATFVVADQGEISSGTVDNRFNGGTVEYMVTGENSEWNAGIFYLGGRTATDPHGDDALLVLANQGQLTASSLYVHHAGRLHGDSTVATTTGTGVINRGGLVGPGLVDHTFTHGNSGTSFEIEESIGTLTLDGNYTQEVFDDNGDFFIGTLRIKVGNPSADQLNVLGNISLVSKGGFDPLLEIVEFGSPSLNENDTFQILNWTGTFTGQFNIQAFDPGEGLGWDFSELYTTGFITVIPEPSALLLSAFAAVGLLLRRSRHRGWDSLS